MRRLLAFLPVALLVASCGSDPSTFDNSGEELNDAGSSRIEFRLEEWGDSGVSTHGSGSIDFVKNRGELVFVVEGPRMGKESRKMEVRSLYIGRDSYLGVPYRGKTLWQKSPDYEATGPDRFAPGPGGARPDEVLDLLHKSSKKVELLGNDEIRGVSVDHYRAHIDEKSVGDDAELYEPKGLVIDAWIDDEGLLRRIRIPFGGADGPVEVIDLYDFGLAVDIEAPPADEVISVEEFERLMEKECESGGDETAWCMVFGGYGSIESSGSEEIWPTETMPRTVTDSK